MIELILKLNDRTQVRISGDDSKRCIEEASFYAALPSTCPVCSAPVHLSFRRVKSKQAKTFGEEFSYCGLCCEGTPAHESTFGVHKDKEQTLFYKERDPWTLRTFATEDDGESEPQGQAAEQARPAPQTAAGGIVCEVCSRPLYNNGQVTLSWNKYGRYLCPQHQQGQAPAAPVQQTSTVEAISKLMNELKAPYRAVIDHIGACHGCERIDDLSPNTAWEVCQWLRETYGAKAR